MPPAVLTSQTPNYGISHSVPPHHASHGLPRPSTLRPSGLAPPLHTTPLLSCPAPSHYAPPTSPPNSPPHSLRSPGRPYTPPPLRVLVPSHRPPPAAAGSSGRLPSGVLTLRLHTESKVRGQAAGSGRQTGDPCAVPGDSGFSQLLASSP